MIEHMQARYAVEKDVTNYVRREVNNPWLALTINPLTDKIEVWFEKPSHQPYLVCSKPFKTGEGLEIPQLISHIREIELSDETLAERVTRLERENQAIHKRNMDNYLDKQVPVAEKIHYESGKANGDYRKLYH